MRICFVSPGILYSKNRKYTEQGSESVIYGISKILAKKGHEIFITGRFKELQESKKKINGINFINIQTPNLKDDLVHQIPSTLLYSKGVSKIVDKLNVDVLSLNERFSAYYPSKLNIPKTFTTHNPDAMDFYKEFAIKNNLINLFFFDIKKRFEESVLSNSDKIIALNKYIEDYLKNKGFDNVKVIPNAIDHNKYYNRDDENFILYAGRLNKVKGIPYLIKAFSKINNNTKLLIIGSGSEENRLKKLLTNKVKTKVEFMPKVSKTKLRGYIAQCSIFVLPSLFEMMPVTLIEAMASAKPVIASDIPGPQDIIKNGINGFIFEKSNVEQLTNYLELLLIDEPLRKNIGLNALKSVKNHYTFEKVAEEYLKVFSEIVE